MITDYQTKDLEEEFYDILINKRINTYFQPIVSLKNGGVIGYEALSRGPVDSLLHFPQALFDCAKVMNKTWELDLLCRFKAIERAKEIIGDNYLFINIEPDIIKDPEFKRGFTKEFLEVYDISPENIVFEITENQAVLDYNSFKEIIDNYKGQGYRIAIDDAGDGYSGLRMLAEIRPNFVKIDMGLIRNIDKDMMKKELLKSIQRFSEVTNIKLIAEGIETYDELKALIDIGIEFGQGYYIQKPNPSFIQINQRIKTTIEEINNLKETEVNNYMTLLIGDYARGDNPLYIKDSGYKANECFNHNYNLQGIPVLKNNKVVGLIMRNKFYYQMAKHINQIDFLARNVEDIMDSYPLVVDANELLSEVCHMAISRDEKYVYDYIVVADKGQYKGIVPFAGLLEILLKLQGK